MKRLLNLLILALSIDALAADDIRFTAPAVEGGLVRFAIIGDLTGGEREGVFDAAVAALAQLNPDFVLSVGDLIEGGTEDVAQMEREWAAFTDRLTPLNMPLYPLVGNHDISNMAMREWWEGSVGPRYYHFRLGDYLFLMLDSEDFSGQRFAEIKQLRNDAVAVYKSQGPEAFLATDYSRLDERKFGVMGRAQSDYFIQVLDKNQDAYWVFVLMHKPLWDSASSGYADLEQALGNFSYSVFNGHEHSYNREVRAGVEHIQMGTTGGEFTPKTRGEYMDHILWVTLGRGGPDMVNIKLEGLVGRAGVPLLDAADGASD
ncbi:serine/threonine protein phosphatase [Halioglobus maricola]|uniref:Serine/threonine protein phosphatase n=1 Tax=Halioglobus maricola TaxID=2601894 RepID=A0A5P9NPH7_9GAMM|nr:metallophosphoesterase [Halioglobus maricola]QFU77396.1 serine/threonine protein phosphatase [Halioglobus maricola]